MLASHAGDAASYQCLLTEIMVLLQRYFARRLHGDGSEQVEDLVQETLFAIHKHRATYDTRQAFTPWLYAIARYKLIDFLRRHRRSKHLPIDDMAEFLTSEGHGMEAEIARNDLDAVLETLPERTRNLIRHVKVEGRSVAEISKTTGMSETSIRVVVHRGLKALAARFGGG